MDDSLDSIGTLRGMVKYNLDGSRYVSAAFALGLLCRRLPPYAYSGIQNCYEYEARQLLGEDNEELKQELDNEHTMVFKFMMTADTADSWHQVYRDFRSHAQRMFVKREGGRIQYLLKDHDITRPSGFETIWILLDISLSTCKRVSKGKRMVEEEIFETVCEDMVDLEEGYDNTHIPSVEFASGKSPDLSHEFDDDIPF